MINTNPAPTAYEVCHYVVSSIVDNKEGVNITPTLVNSNLVRLEVQVADGQLGQVIGKRGRVAQAIRTLVQAAGSRDDKDITVDFVD